jgi:NADH-quinone oxidoreductase subunit N
MNFTPPDLMPAYPEILLLIMASVILLVDLFVGETRRWITYALSIFTLVGCALLTVAVGQATGGEVTYTFSNMFVVDHMGNLLKLLSYLAVAACIIYSRTYLADRGLLRGEYFVLLLFAQLGIMVMISANHFLPLYLGLELLSLCQYSLVALNRDSSQSTEAAMKYFVLGAIASGMLLYGMSMMYGATGTLEITELAKRIGEGNANRTVLLFGLVFLVSGLAFKMGVVPFHMWLPDVYHGAPSAITLVIATAPKLAAFAMAIRLLVNGTLGFDAQGQLSATAIELATNWQQMLIILAVLSMAIGNLVAIAQTNIKRMLAYSTISQMGFLLLGMLAGVVGGNVLSAADAYAASLFYAIAYLLMSLGAWGMVVLLSRAGFEAENLDDFKGLNARSPWFAFIMLLLMFSLAGLPPTVGFFAKYSVILAVVQADKLWLAVVAVLFSLIGAFYYLRIVRLMYFDDPVDKAPVAPRMDMGVLLSANGLAVLFLGLFPGPLMALCYYSIKSL